MLSLPSLSSLLSSVHNSRSRQERQERAGRRTECGVPYTTSIAAVVRSYLEGAAVAVHASLLSLLSLLLRNMSRPSVETMNRRLERQRRCSNMNISLGSLHVLHERPVALVAGYGRALWSKSVDSFEWSTSRLIALRQIWHQFTCAKGNA